MTKPGTLGRLIKWIVEMGEFDTEYQGRTAVKAQVLADFIIEMTGEENQTKENPWRLHVDGSSNYHSGGVRVWLQGLDGVEVEFTIELAFPVTNNEAEYEVLIARL